MIRSAEADGSRVFEITDAGREHLETRAGEPDPWIPTDGRSENAMAELGPLVIGIGKAVWQVASVGSEAQRARALALLDETRRGPVPDPRRGAATDADDTEAGLRGRGIARCPRHADSECRRGTGEDPSDR